MHERPPIPTYYGCLQKAHGKLHLSLDVSRAVTFLVHNVWPCQRLATLPIC